MKDDGTTRSDNEPRREATRLPTPEPLRRLRRHLGRLGRRWGAQAVRLSRRVRFGGPAVTLPAVFGNSMAKAGSHLLAQYLHGLTSITPLLFLDPYPIRTITEDGHRRGRDDVVRELRRLSPGEIRWGYVPAQPEYIEALLAPNRVVYFLYRDPRDKVVSHILYALNIHKRHAMHDYYGRLPGMEERIAATIRGVPGLVQDIRASYQSYLPWLERPEVIPVAYEDLMQRRPETLQRMLAHLDRAGIEIRTGAAETLDLLQREMSPRHSPTYRAGSPGNWQTYFSDANKRLFKEVTGDLLIRLRYEQGMDW